jgi:FkbM family methyltransferase
VNQFQPGYFIEIGANDGFTFSNTVYLEEHYGWTGVLVEANTKYANSLSKRKKSLIVNQAISDQSGVSEFIDGGLYGGLTHSLDQTHSRYTNNAPTITVPCITLEEMFHLAQSPKVIDFLSIDVEGGEIPIARQFISSDRRVRCGCIEVNYRNDDITELDNILEKAGYMVVWRGFTGHDIFFIDPKLCRNTLYY